MDIYVPYLTDSTCCLSFGCLSIIAIDFGSVSARVQAMISGAVPGGRVLIQIDNQDIDVVGERFMSGDFTTHGYCLDGRHPVYVGEVFDATRTQTQMKYYMYCLVETDDEMDTLIFDEYPLTHDIVARKDNPNFLDRLRSGLEGLTARLKAAIDSQACQKYDADIQTVVLTIPAQWTLEFEEVLADLWAPTFNWSRAEARSNIFFYTEGEAMANFIFRDQRMLFQLSKLCPAGVFPDAVIILDYGGHNLVSAGPHHANYLPYHR